MKATVKKWGNSLAIRIPAALAEAVGITENSPVELDRDGEGLAIVPIRSSRRRTARRPLSEYVEQITPENRHSEIQTGGPQGREAW